MATCQPDPWDCAAESPVYSCQRLLRNSFEPSGRRDQASVGIVSITCRSFFSDFSSSSSALSSASCDCWCFTKAIAGLYVIFPAQRGIPEKSGLRDSLSSMGTDQCKWSATCFCPSRLPEPIKDDTADRKAQRTDSS